jgi:uncharacterized protein (TIGR00369 family)
LEASNVETKNPNYRDKLERAFAGAAFVAENGIRLVDCGPGWCEAVIELTPHHLQHIGVPHGGLIATLADHTAGGAAATLVAVDEHVLTAEFKISFLRGVKAERLFCRAEVIKPGSQLVFVESTVEAEAAGKRTLISKASVTLAVVAASKIR